jgi:hypothetical protein
MGEFLASVFFAASNVDTAFFVVLISCKCHELSLTSRTHFALGRSTSRSRVMQHDMMLTRTRIHTNRSLAFGMCQSRGCLKIGLCSVRVVGDKSGSVGKV